MPADPTSLPMFGAEQPVTDVPRRAWVEQIMGMPISIHLRGPDCDGPVTAAAVSAVFAELREVDAVFSTWKPDSEVSRLQRGELALQDCRPDVREVARLCTVARERTEGWFDADLPRPDGSRVFDPTGLVKGWAVQRAARHLAAVPGHDHLLNAGGDVTVGCRRTDTPDWRIGIENPADRSRLLATVPLRTGGVATSGTAARGTHILQPTTGRAATALRAVSVVGPELMWADVYATAAFARGPGCTDWLAALPDHVSLVVDLDGTVTTLPA